MMFLWSINENLSIICLCSQGIYLKLVCFKTNDKQKVIKFVCSVIIDNFKSFRQLEILIAFLPNICAIAVTRACSPEGVWEAVTNSTYAPCGLHGDHIAVSIFTSLYFIKTQSNVTLPSLSRVKCSLRPVCVYFCA
jgi:hypothetical protein